MSTLEKSALQEQARLIAHGVRAMALVGECGAGEIEILRAYTMLEACACPRVLAFVADRGDGIADLGYAAASWVIELYRWLTTDHAVPEIHQHRMIGLLLGYAPSSIREFEEGMRHRPARVNSVSAG